MRTARWLLLLLFFLIFRQAVTIFFSPFPSFSYRVHAALEAPALGGVFQVRGLVRTLSVLPWEGGFSALGFHKGS